MWLTVACASLSLVSFGPVSATLPHPVPTCTAPKLPNVQKAITFQEIAKLSRVLESDFRAKGWCFRLVEERIYGALQHSDSLTECDDIYHAFFNGLDKDGVKAQKYAGYVKDEFRTAFDGCDNSTCVVQNFCRKIVDYVPCGKAPRLAQDLYYNCVDEGWRFQEFIFSNDTEKCKFKVIPQPWADQCQANRTHKEGKDECHAGSHLECDGKDEHHPYCKLEMGCNENNPMCWWYECQRHGRCDRYNSEKSKCQEKGICHFYCPVNGTSTTNSTIPTNSTMPHCNMCKCKASPWLPECQIKCINYPWLPKCQAKKCHMKCDEYPKHPYCNIKKSCDDGRKSNLCTWFRCHVAGKDCTTWKQSVQNCTTNSNSSALCGWDCSNPLLTNKTHCNMCDCISNPHLQKCEMTCEKYPEACPHPQFINCSMTANWNHTECWSDCKYDHYVQARVCRADCVKHPEHPHCINPPTTAPTPQATTTAGYQAYTVELTTADVVTVADVTVASVDPARCDPKKAEPNSAWCPKNYQSSTAAYTCCRQALYKPADSGNKKFNCDPNGTLQDATWCTKNFDAANSEQKACCISNGYKKKVRRAVETENKRIVFKSGKYDVHDCGAAYTSSSDCELLFFCESLGAEFPVGLLQLSAGKSCDTAGKKVSSITLRVQAEERSESGTRSESADSMDAYLEALGDENGDDE